MSERLIKYLKQYIYGSPYGMLDKYIFELVYFVLYVRRPGNLNIIE